MADSHRRTGKAVCDVSAAFRYPASRNIAEELSPICAAPPGSRDAAGRAFGEFRDRLTPRLSSYVHNLGDTEDVHTFHLL